MTSNDYQKLFSVAPFVPNYLLGNSSSYCTKYVCANSAMSSSNKPYIFAC